ncbi:MAG: 16S rRNA (adenine(1518)-N(6)/adenine(1519)-N(6))-dimethyltransferase RsmA [Oligoflexales bacterium]
MRRKFWPEQKKSLSQVFLQTDWPIHKVVEHLETWKIRRVLEIGPGGGVLTRALVDAGFNTFAVEKDERFVERLKEYFQDRARPNNNRLEIMHRDILQFDLPEWLERSAEPTAIVGNVPYKISTPILMWLLPHISKVKGAVFMVQLEFGNRLAAHHGTKSYGSLSVFAQLRSNVEILCKVDRTCFHPVPKVDSALVTLRPKASVPSPEILAQVESLTRGAFSQRRKKLRNAIRTVHTGIDEKDFPLDLDKRPENVSPEEYVAVAQFLASRR